MSHNHMPGMTTRPATSQGVDRKGHHRWMMIACCIPMLAVAIGLVVTGAVSLSFLVFAGACVLMMAMMMGGMGHGSK